MPKPPKPEPFVVTVRVVPRASQNKIELQDDGSLKVWVKSPPVDGEANKAVCELIAKATKVANSAVRVEAGRTSREKRIRVEGLTCQEARSRLLASRGHGA